MNVRRVTENVRRVAETAVLFPGQGSQRAESRALVAAECPELLERCCELVGEDPFPRVDESTRFAQPAIFCASLAGWTRLAPEGLVALAGHSLGEFSALAAGDALDVFDALGLVVVRGELMAAASERSADGGMLALLRATLEQAEELAAKHRVAVANDNAPGQVVLSGDLDGLHAVATEARQLDLRAIRLAVSGAFHSPAMATAEGSFLEALRDVKFREPRVPVFSALTATPFVAPFQLAAGITRRVRWRETMQALARFGVTRFVDVGPGQTLAKLVERNLPRSIVETVEDCDGVAV